MYVVVVVVCALVWMLCWMFVEWKQKEEWEEE